MKLWPWGKKAAAPMAIKSASWVFGPGALQTMQHRYEVFASEGYSLNPFVRACVDKITQAIASVDLKAYTQKKDGGMDEMPGHPILAILSRPNPMMAGSDFRRALLSYYLISGNAYVYGPGVDPMAAKPKPPKELYLLRPSCVEVVKGPGVFPLGYKYREREGKEVFYPVNQLNGNCAVMHKRTFHPLEDHKGLSPMVTAAFDIDICNEGSKWNLRLLQNEGRPSGALMVKTVEGDNGTLPVEQYNRIKEQLEQQFTGSNNAGRPLLLEGGLEWQEMSLSARDMDHEKNMNAAARRIALAFGVPPMLLGIPGDNKYANMEEAKLAFWGETVLPLLSSMLESLNNWLGPMYGDGIQLWYDEEMIPALEPQRKAKAERIEAASSLSVNEKRRAMGHDDIPGGDVVLVDSGKIPLEMAGQLDLNEPGSEADIDENSA